MPSVEINKHQFNIFPNRVSTLSLGLEYQSTTDLYALPIHSWKKSRAY
jgi:hypothetical protein